MDYVVVFMAIAVLQRHENVVTWSMLGSFYLATEVLGLASLI
jgi:hypothetical protein